MQSGVFTSRGMAFLTALLLLATLSIAGTAAPDTNWQFGPASPFAYARFDGENYSEADSPGFGATRTFFLGGRLSDGSTSGTVWSFDGTIYSMTGATMAVPVSNYQIAKLKNAADDVLLYIFGGRNSVGTLIGTVQTYDPVTNTTAVLDPADDYPGVTSPSNCQALPANGQAISKTRAVVTGGISAPPTCGANEVTDQTWYFNAKAASGNMWTQGPALTMARGYITLATIGPNIYAIGGDIWVGTALVAQNRVETTTRTAGAWTQLADLPQACDESQAFGFKRGTLADHVILAGCGQWPNTLVNTYNYDAVANSWADSAPLNEARRNHAGFLSPLSKRRMFVLGGYDTGGATARSTSETSPAKPPLGASRGASPGRSPSIPGAVTTH